MNEHSSASYDALAEKQHLIFKDWNTSIDWQASIIGPLLEREFPTPSYAYSTARAALERKHWAWRGAATSW